MAMKNPVRDSKGDALKPKPTKAAKAVAAPKRKRPALKIPKNLAQVADLLYTTKDERLAEARKVAEIAEDEKVLKNHLIENLPKGEASAVAGKVARASIVKQPIPRIDDQDKLRAAIKRSPKKYGHLLKTVIDTEALQEILDSGDPMPPGTSVFNVIKVSLNKV